MVFAEAFIHLASTTALRVLTTELWTYHYRRHQCIMECVWCSLREFQRIQEASYIKISTLMISAQHSPIIAVIHTPTFVYRCLASPCHDRSYHCRTITRTYFVDCFIQNPKAPQFACHLLYTSNFFMFTYSSLSREEALYEFFVSIFW